jgi:IclR family transcriptional regulator, acetate operon repressor
MSRGVSAPSASAPNSILDRALELLRVYEAHPGSYTLGELAFRSALPRSTTHRIVNRLTDQRILQQNDGRYSIGVRLFELGMLFEGQQTLREAALPFMEDLYEAVHETVHLAIPDGLEVLYIEKISGHHVATAASRIGGRMPMHCTALGKAMLAFGPPELLAQVVSSGLERRTPFTITAEHALRRDLADARERGVAIEREEAATGVGCAAAPIIVHHHLQAALSVTAPLHRLAPETIGPAIRTAALAVARALS